MIEIYHIIVLRMVRQTTLNQVVLGVPNRANGLPYSLAVRFETPVKMEGEGKRRREGRGKERERLTMAVSGLSKGQRWLPRLSELHPPPKRQE